MATRVTRLDRRPGLRSDQVSRPVCCWNVRKPAQTLDLRWSGGRHTYTQIWGANPHCTVGGPGSAVGRPARFLEMRPESRSSRYPMVPPTRGLKAVTGPPVAFLGACDRLAQFRKSGPENRDVPPVPTYPLVQCLKKTTRPGRKGLQPATGPCRNVGVPFRGGRQSTPPRTPKHGDTR